MNYGGDGGLDGRAEGGAVIEGLGGYGGDPGFGCYAEEDFGVGEGLLGGEVMTQGFVGGFFGVDRLEVERAGRAARRGGGGVDKENEIRFGHGFREFGHELMDGFDADQRIGSDFGDRRQSIGDAEAEGIVATERIAVPNNEGAPLLEDGGLVHLGGILRRLRGRQSLPDYMQETEVFEMLNGILALYSQTRDRGGQRDEKDGRDETG